MQPTGRMIAWIVGLALLTAPAVTQATEVRGKLEVLPGWLNALDQRLAAQPEQGPATRYWEVGNGAASIDPLVVDPTQELGILVRSAEGKPLDPLSTTEPELLVRNLAFQPAVAFAPEGKSVIVRNLDLFDHDFVVESEKGGAELPREDLDGGRSFRVRFNASGLYVVRCRNFPFLRGYVFVDKEPVRFVQPAADGSFSLGDVPPGKYTLAVFNASAAASSAPTPAAGWIATPCPLEVPAPPGATPATPATAEGTTPAPAEGAAPATPAPAETPAAPRRGEQAEPPATPAPPPVFQLTVRLGAQGTTETVECVAAFPAPPAPATPAPAAGGRGR
ncbi:MAG: hypothetical protein JXB32_05460 [Deltaproteobacteria bacterium]|nr:hypothetical protein [Deltaproteobacteria bacterium]